MKTTISVVTATYNQAQFLPDCIKSVAASIIDPLGIGFEHVVFDDGSTDNTRNVAKKYKHIRYFRWSKNRGVSAARNQAIREAKGEFIFVLDSDDVVLQRTLFYLYTKLHRSKNQWIYCDFIRADKNLKYLIAEDYYGWKFKNVNQMLTAIFKCEHFIQHNVMFTKKLFWDSGEYDENLSVTEDLDLYIRFLKNLGLPDYIPMISHLHRCHGSNLSIGHSGEQHFKNCKLLAKKYNWKKK